jgi:hypothetical protein
MLEIWGFKVSIVVRLAIHLLRLIPLRSAATNGESNENQTVEFYATEVVTQSIGDDPQFLWAQTVTSFSPTQIL